MKKDRSMKQRLICAVLVFVMAVTSLIGTTFAWFTDEVTSAGNKIQSGTLKVDLELLDKETGEWSSLKKSQAPIFNQDKWEPGYIDAKVLKVENEGNLALKWVAKFYSENQLSILADVIDVYVRPSDSEIGYPADRNLDGYTCVGNLRTFINSIEETTWGTLEAKEASYLGIALKMREEAGDEYQGLSLGGAFDIRIFATQHTSESDSFDDMYDSMKEKDVLVSQVNYLTDGKDKVDFSLFYKGTKIVAISVPADAVLDSTQPITATIDAIDPETAGFTENNTQIYAYDINVSNLKKNLSGDQLVTVVVSVPNALAEIKAYHKGVLIEDAEYDEVAGTVTFKTASFSPFAFESPIIEVETLEQLRDALQKEGTTAKLIADIEVDLTKDTGKDRDINHAYVGANNTYYNGVMINGKDVGLDLNGHSITAFCGDEYNSNSDVGALFFVGANGSLNITNKGAVETGFIKMKSSIYAVWAPFADPSYVDIYGGAFIADSYAGDPVGTPLGSDGKYDAENGTMSITQENSNRSIIYAGYGGNINVYGGYFLYNNTVNDKSNRNNGAFNAKDYYEAGALITIHDSVYLSNKEYRQNPYRNPQTNPSFDDYSIKLADENLYQISEVTLENAVKIDGVEYSTWYQVSRAFKYKVTFKDYDGKELDTQYIMEDKEVKVEEIDDTARGKLTGESETDFIGWINLASQKVTSIAAGNIKDIELYATYADKYTARFIDENGNIVQTIEFTKNESGLNKLKNVAVPPTTSEFFVDGSGYWTVEDGTGSPIPLNSLEISKVNGDITLHAAYELDTSGNAPLILQGVDTDGDGRFNHYVVNSAKEDDSNINVVIPDYVNGIPVIEILGGAFAEFDNITTVTIPVTIIKLGEDSFANRETSGILSTLKYEQMTFLYEGTYEQWQKIEKDPNWDRYVGQGSKIYFLADGTYIEETASNGRWSATARVWSDPKTGTYNP